MFISFKKAILFLAFCLSFFFSETFSYGQEIAKSKESILGIANSLYGADDRLVNGKFYVPKHYGGYGNPYFESNNWLDGTLFIKGIQYNDIPLKYNIEDDELIINVSFANKSASRILLYNAFVDSLIIDSQIFHNTDNFGTNNPIGFAEFIYKGDSLSAYFKHSIEFLDVITDKGPNGKYLKPKKKLYFLEHNRFLQISSKKAFLAYFEDHKKEIRLYMRKNQFYFKKANANQFAELLDFSENL